jgi:hypothetical protein
MSSLRSFRSFRIMALAAAALMLTLTLAPRPAAAITAGDVVKGPYGSLYRLVWDGFQGDLTLFSNGTGSLAVGPTYYSVRAVYGANAQDVISGYQGPGYRVNVTNAHRVILWIDLARTPNNTADDQRFDGYFFTNTLNGMAGVTWWSNIPFGFQATFVGNLYTL